MQKIAVITGGAGGMGLATANLLGREHILVITDVSREKLDAAAASLRERGMQCEAIVCDVADARSVAAMAQQAAALGDIAAVVHTAGISPQMAGPEAILRVNALGTVHIADAFHALAAPGFALVNVASMAAHLLPAWLAPERIYRHAATDPDRFVRRALLRCRFLPTALHRNGFAYAISKHFVIWFSRQQAARFGERGARILSVSPGTFDTQMGRLEEKSGSMKMLETAALKRAGTPEEMAELLAFCASDKASYLTGTDILCDGGVVAGRAGHGGRPPTALAARC